MADSDHSSTEEGEGSSQHSDTDMWSESESELDSHVHARGEFYGCYLLVSKNPKFKGRVYIGFTVDPNRRLKQHNHGCHKGGAKKTSGRGPWDMILIVHGFPSQIAALRFEWAWQHPRRSRRLGKSLARKRRGETSLEYHFRILTEMLSVGPWCRLPLTIRWLKQEYALSFPPDKQPPVHMPIAYGRVDLAKSKPSSQHCSSLSQPNLTEDAVDSSGNEECCVTGQDGEKQTSCQFCGDDRDGEKLLHCYYKSCSLSAHVTCLAPRLHKNDGPHLIPISGPCPKCGRELLWGELIRKYKRKIKSAEDLPKKRKRPLPSSQPTSRAKRIAEVSKTGNSHWSEALHMQ